LLNQKVRKKEKNKLKKSVIKCCQVEKGFYICSRLAREISEDWQIGATFKKDF